MTTINEYLEGIAKYSRDATWEVDRTIQALDDLNNNALKSLLDMASKPLKIAFTASVEVAGDRLDQAFERFDESVNRLAPLIEKWKSTMELGQGSHSAAGSTGVSGQEGAGFGGKGNSTLEKELAVESRKATKKSSSNLMPMIDNFISRFTTRLDLSFENKQGSANTAGLRGQGHTAFKPVFKTLGAITFGSVGAVLSSLAVGVAGIGFAAKGAGKLVRESGKAVGPILANTARKMREPLFGKKGGGPGLLATQVLPAVATHGGALAKASLGGAIEKKRLEDRFIAKTGDEGAGKEMADHFKKSALEAGQDVNQVLNNTLRLMSITENTDHLDKLNTYSARLSTFDPESRGIEDAASALESALKTGNLDGLAERYGIPEKMAKESSAVVKLKEGDIEGFLAGFDELLEKAGMGSQAMEHMMSTPAAQLAKLQNFAKTALAEAGDSALASFMPVVQLLTEAFDSGKLQPFFDMLSSSFQFLAGIVSWAVEWVVANLDAVKNILFAVGIAALVAGTLMAISWLQAFWPVLLLIGIIGLVMLVLNEFGVSTEAIIGFVSGLFKVLGTVIGAVITAIVESIKFIANGIKKLFNLFSKSKNMEDVLQDTEMPEVEKQNKLSMKYEEMGNKEESRAKFGSALFKGVDGRFDLPTGIGDTDVNNVLEPHSGKTLSAATQSDGSSYAQPSPNIGKVNEVGEVGSVRDTVDISNEDLQIMRELAEMNQIQNFVSLQPSYSFGDTHVRNESDIDTIISKFSERLERDIYTSADAAYS